MKKKLLSILLVICMLCTLLPMSVLAATPAENEIKLELVKDSTTFTGKDGSTKAYTLTKDNLQAIRDIMAAYTTLLDSDASTAQSVLSSLAK